MLVTAENSARTLRGVRFGMLVRFFDSPRRTVVIIRKKVVGRCNDKQSPHGLGREPTLLTFLPPRRPRATFLPPLFFLVTWADLLIESI